MTTTPADAPARPPVREMVVIHRFFRRELAAVPGLLRSTPAGDTARAAVVAEHLGFVLGSLHVHHTTEDELLWPRLLERAPVEAALVATMEEQHHVVEGLLQQAEPLLAPWAASADPARAGVLADLVEGLHAALVEHLDLEEAEILPLVERHLSVQEWAELGEHGKDATPRKQLPLLFGAFLEEADDQERAMMLANVPPPVRFFLRTAGAWQYRRYITRVRGL